MGSLPDLRRTRSLGGASGPKRHLPTTRSGAKLSSLGRRRAFELSAPTGCRRCRHASAARRRVVPRPRTSTDRTHATTSCWPMPVSAHPGGDAHAADQLTDRPHRSRLPPLIGDSRAWTRVSGDCREIQGPSNALNEMAARRDRGLLGTLILVGRRQDCTRLSLVWPLSRLEQTTHVGAMRG